MTTPVRYLLLALALIISFHYILSFTHEEYGKLTSLESIKSHLSGSKATANKLAIPDDVFTTPSQANYTRANATFVILVRNSELEGMVRSIRDMEYRFNRVYQYPYVLLNDEPFTEVFKKRVSVLTDVKMEFGLIPKDHWNQPDWIDEEKATASRQKMVDEGIVYGGSVSYRNMCRFNAGFFFKHELLQKYRYYWRIEPGVSYHCDLHFDPFTFMHDYNKTYGFTMTMYEFEKTITTLWGHTMDFAKEHPEYIAADNSLGFMSENGGSTYNLCHFWSNFEIADMDFWRGPAYTAYFEYLESKGGFYYERWGDAPVHSIAAAFFLQKDQIHFFNDIGYEHPPYGHCPRPEEKWKKGKCSCDPDQSFDYDGYSCMPQWEKFMLN